MDVFAESLVDRARVGDLQIDRDAKADDHPQQCGTGHQASHSVVVRHA
jgi:hypothetical protein